MERPSQSLQIFYGLCAVAGVVATGYFNLQFIGQHGGFSAWTFITENYVNHASASISNDLLVVVVAFLGWSFVEARRLNMRHWWAYVVLTFVVAIAFALPLFLLNRERKLGEIKSEDN